MLFVVRSQRSDEQAGAHYYHINRYAVYVYMYVVSEYVFVVHTNTGY